MPQATALTTPSQVSEFIWGEQALPLRFLTEPDGAVRLVSVGALRTATKTRTPALPLVELHLAGSGRDWSGERSTESAAGARLVYQGHEVTDSGQESHLRVDLLDPATGLAVEAHYRSWAGLAAVRTWVTLRNGGPAPVVVEAVTSLLLPGLAAVPADAATGLSAVPASPSALDRIAGLELSWADNDWLAEGRWHTAPLRELLVRLNLSGEEHAARNCFARSSQGSWSTGRHLPAGILRGLDGGLALAWQVEHSGGWRWEVGEAAGAAYLALLGPSDREHQWRQVLHPGEEFTSVPAAVALAGADKGTDAATAALGQLTHYRRAVRRPHRDHRELPVVFNDYMNTLMGDPSTERLLPLVAAAGRAGAEYFVIDAGWYDDDAQGWWDSVGAWEEAPARFPGGLREVCDRIREAGMVPGLWLEPEVVGVRSPIARDLPDAAFFRRDGLRVVEHGRYHLDLRHPGARGHLDRVVDRLVADYGVGYLKLDYNVNIGPGTDTDGGGSPGVGLLGHQRAYADWLSGVLDRHPGLTLENCSSGGMRADYGLLSLLQLQSTSDQEHFLRYPPIAVSAPASIAPEQSAVWAYPQPEFTDAEIAFTLAGAVLGRVHLSGHLDRMTEDQFALVTEAVAVHKSLRAELPRSTPFWPLGLPGWEDGAVGLGLRTLERSLLTIWRRYDAPDSVTLPVPHLRGLPATVRVLYPGTLPAEARWDAEAGAVRLRLPQSPGACVLAVEPLA